jgi:hypothetical protein
MQWQILQQQQHKAERFSRSHGNMGSSWVCRPQPSTGHSNNINTYKAMPYNNALPIDSISFTKHGSGHTHILQHMAQVTFNTGVHCATP